MCTRQFDAGLSRERTREKLLADTVEAASEFRSVLINEDEQNGNSAVLLTWARANAELPMCETCNELDKKIEHYERIAFSLNDQLTIDRFKELISKLEAQKKALHPEQQ